MRGQRGCFREIQRTHLFRKSLFPASTSDSKNLMHSRKGRCLSFKILRTFHRYVFRVEAVSRSQAMETASTRKKYLGMNRKHSREGQRPSFKVLRSFPGYFSRVEAVSHCLRSRNRFNSKDTPRNESEELEGGALPLLQGLANFS